MKLLVSVGDGVEAAAALTGGADIIDAKDPHRGAMGAVSMGALRAIHSAIAGARPFSAALGDATDEQSIESRARAFAAAGVQFVKVGFAGATAERVAALIARTVRGAGGPRDVGVFAVAYADADRAVSPAPGGIVEAAAHAGAIGVLLDTADKRGPGLRGLVTPAALAAWVAEAHAGGLIAALAGKLTADDLLMVRDAGADIAGVRGAACDTDRTGRVTADNVRRLQERLRVTKP